jgi:hypothetical protein
MLRSALFTTLLALSVSAGAQGFDYNYFQLGYSTIDIDSPNVDGDGLSLGASYAINTDFHVFAGYTSGDLDFNVDTTSWSAGFGYNTELSDKVDAYARLSYEYAEIDVPFFGGFDDNGLGFTVGLRFAASPDVELGAAIGYVDLGDSGDDTGFELSALYNFSDAFAMGLSGDWSDDVSVYSLNGRFYFGK